MVQEAKQELERRKSAFWVQYGLVQTLEKIYIAKKGGKTNGDKSSNGTESSVENPQV